MAKAKKRVRHSKGLSNRQKVKLMELACSLPQDLNGTGWKGYYKEMVELVTGTIIQTSDTRLPRLENIPLAATPLPVAMKMRERENARMI